MAGWRLAELFVEISTKGNWRHEMDSLQKKFGVSAGVVANMSKQYANAIGPTKTTIDSLNDMIDQINARTIEVKFMGTDDGEKLLETSRLLRSELERINAIKTMQGAMSEYKSIMAAGIGSDASTSAQPKPMDSTVEEFAAKVKRLQDMKLEVKFLGTDEGKKLLAVQKELAKEMGKTNSARNLLVMEGTVGKMSMAMRELKEGMQGFGNQSVVQFGIASASIMGLTRAASPVAFSTLTKSFELLSAQIGTAFLPAIMDASKWIQDAAGWVGGLDKETKQQIGTWAAYGVGLLGVVTIGPRIVGLIGTLRGMVLAGDLVVASLWKMGFAAKATAVDFSVLATTGTAAAGGIGKATSALWLFTKAHPVTMVLGLVGAVLGLNAAFGGTVDKVAETTKKIGELEALLNRMRQSGARGGPISSRDLQRALPYDVRRRLEDASPEERERILQEQEGRSRGSLQQAQEAAGPNGVARAIEEALRPFENNASATEYTTQRREALRVALGQFNMKPEDIGAGSTWFMSNNALRGQGPLGAGNMGQSGIDSVIANAENLVRRRAMESGAELGASASVRQNGMPTDRPRPSDPGQAGVDQMFRNALGNGRFNRMMSGQPENKSAEMDFNGFQSQTMGIGDAWSRLQTAALGKSPLQNKIDQVQWENMASLFDNIKEMNASLAAINAKPSGIRVF